MAHWVYVVWRLYWSGSKGGWLLAPLIGLAVLLHQPFPNDRNSASFARCWDWERILLEEPSLRPTWRNQCRGAV